MFRHRKGRLIAAAAALALSSVLAVRVMGTSPLPDAVKLAPAMVSVDTSGLAPKLAQAELTAGWRIFDRDTETAYTPSQTARITVSLSEQKTISRIRLYGASSYQLNVYRDNAGAWEPVPSLTGKDLTAFAASWNTLAPESPFSAAHLLLEFIPQGNITAGIRELEIWGNEPSGSIETASHITLEGIKTPQEALAILSKNAPHVIEVSAAPSQITVPDSTVSQDSGFAYLSLTQNPAVFKRAYILYDGYNIYRPVSIKKRINGLSWSGGFIIAQPEGTTPGWASFIEEINPAWLVQGENKLEFKSISGTAYVRGLKLVIETDSGWNAVSSVTTSALYDGDTATSYEIRASSTNPSIQINFERPAQPENIRLHLPGPMNLKAGLQYQTTTGWVDVQAGWQIDLSLMQAGWNEIAVPASITTDALRIVIYTNGLRIKPGIRVGTINEVRVSASPAGAVSSAPRIIISYPRDGEYFGRTAYIQGFAAPASNGSDTALVDVEGKTSANTDGAFGLSLTKDETRFFAQPDDEAWDPIVKTEYGTQAGASLTLQLNKNSGSASSTTPTKESRGDAPFADNREKYTDKVAPGQAKKIQYKGVTLDIPAGAVDKETEITIIPLTEADLARLNPGMINVTFPDAGYRFLPHGMKFLKPIKISFGYSKTLFAAGQVDDEVNMYYYDEKFLRWQALKRVKVDPALSQVESESDHFTDIINSTLVVPEHPQALSFNPNSIKDIKAADPSANVNLIEPPQANNKGTANMSYPIEVPPGRNKLQPNLAVQYNSSGGNGWMGQGWDISLSAITIDTRWGVPRYNPDSETETYTLDGEQLDPVAHRGPLQPRSTDDKIFHPRVEGQFRKIIRHGTAPNSYWWEVIDKNGTKYFYGGDPVANGPVTESILTDAGGNIFKWALRRVQDANINTINYTYSLVTDSGTGSGTGGVSGYQLYPKAITYTGHGTAAGPYTVLFIRDRELPDYSRRTDVIIDARGGFKMVTADFLRKVEVTFTPQPVNGQPQQAQLVRGYEFKYNENSYGDDRPGTAFNKSLLTSVTQYGTDGHVFNTHKFIYYDDARNSGGSYIGYASTSEWNTGSDGIRNNKIIGGSLVNTKASAINGTTGSTKGEHMFVGISIDLPGKRFSDGFKVGDSETKSESKLQLIDINGDGLPDKVFDQDGKFYRPNRSGPDGGTAFGEKLPVENLPGILKEKSETSTSGAEIYLDGANGILDDSDTFTKTETYFSDVNGDGLPDLVKDGQVFFNYVNFDQNSQHGVPTFTLSSAPTPAPIGSGVVDTTGLIPDFSDIYERLLNAYPLMDTVRRWIAPFDGHVRITGSVSLVQDTSQERQDYTTADGVQVAIQHEGTELWSAQTVTGDPRDPSSPRILADDYSSHTPAGVDDIAVKQGDRIYFRVQSVFDGKYDQVIWDPEITYINVPDTLRDVNDLNPYRYKASEDFVYAGRDSVIAAPFTGTIRITGDFKKKDKTSDNIAVVIYKNDTPVFTRQMAWDEIADVNISLDVDVVRKDNVSPKIVDTIKLRVLVDSPIDLGRIEWTPHAYYVEAYSSEETQRDENGDPIDPGVPPGSLLPVTDENGNYLIQLKPAYDVELYPANNLTAPLQPWKAPKDGYVYVTPWLLFNPLTPPTSGFYFTVKRRNELIQKRFIAVINGVMVPEPYNNTVVVQVQKDDELFFDFSTRDTELLKSVWLSKVSVAYSGDLTWKPFKGGTVTVTPALQLADVTPAPSGKILFAARRGSEILGRRIIDIDHGSVPNWDSMKFNITVNKDDEIFFDYLTVSNELFAAALLSHRVIVAYEASQTWRVPSTGLLVARPSLSFDFNGATPSGEITFGVKRNSTVEGEIQVKVENGVVTNPDVGISMYAWMGDLLHIYYRTSNVALTNYITNYGTRIRYGLFGSSSITLPSSYCTFTILWVPNNLHLEEGRSAQFNANTVPNAFARPYRGWAAVAYNGNRDRARKPIDQSLLFVDRNYKIEDAKVYLLNPSPSDRQWISSDQFCWVEAGVMSSSRLGLDYVSVPKSDDFGTVSGGSPASAVSRLSSGSSDVKGVGASFLSGSVADGSSHGQLDFMDMNGDRFPDVVGYRRIQYTEMTGGLGSKTGALPLLPDNSSSVRKNSNYSRNIGIGGSPAKNKQNGKSDVNASGAKGTVTGEQGSEMPPLGLSVSKSRGSSDSSYELMDINGDGLPDRLYAGGDVAFNLGYSFAGREPWGGGVINDGESKDTTLSISGFNDWIFGYAGGLSFTTNSSWTSETLVDINGDGLPDLVSPASGGLSVHFNTGAGFVSSSAAWKDALTTNISKSSTTSQGGGVYFTISTPIVVIPIPPTIIWLNINPGYNPKFANNSMSRQETAIMDMNGDGYPDHVTSSHDGSMTVAENPTGRTNLLKTVTRPLGGRFDISYVRKGNTYNMPQSQWVMSRVLLTDGMGHTYRTDYGYADPLQDRYEREFYGFKTVSETHAPGTSIERTVVRTFHNDNYYLKGLMKRSVTVDKQGLNTRVWAMTENTYTLTPVQDKNTVFDHAAFPALTRTDTYFYDGTTSYDGDPASTYGHRKNTYQTFAYDGFGNVTSFFDAGELLTAADDVTATITYWSSPHDYIIKPGEILITHGSTQLRKRTASYDGFTGNLTSLALHNTGGTESRWTMTYDEYGNIATITDPVGYILTYTYDSEVYTYVTKIEDNFPKPYFSEAGYNLLFGQLAWSKDLNGNYQVNGYDEFGRLVSIHGPYDTDRAGNPLHANSPTIAFEYIAPVLDSSALSASSAVNSITAPASAVTHNKAVSINGSEGNLLTTVTFADGMKRIIQTKKEADVDAGSGRTQYGMVVSGTVEFDALGRVVKQGQPVFETGYSTAMSYQPSAKNATEFYYDTHDRTTMVITPDGATTTTTYGFGQVNNSGLLYAKTIVVDPEGNKVNGTHSGTKISFKDVDDRIVAVTEYNGSPITTVYDYDPLGQITTVTDDKDHSTTIEYDLQGHRTAIDNPDTGRTEYGYDANGNLTSKLTANYTEGTKITYEYDFNRLIKINYPNSTPVEYVYGAMGEIYNRAGRIKKVTDESGTEERYYGKLGEVTREERTVEAHTPAVQKKKFSTDYVFDSFGRMVEMTWPDGEVLKYAYDNGGLLKAAWGEKKGNRYDYVKTLTYDEFGQRKWVEYGNGVVSTYAYNELTRRLSTLDTTLKDGRNIQKLKYEYDLVGNVLNLNNGIEIPTSTALPAGPVTQNFTYDDLYQIKTADGEYLFGPSKQNKYHNEFVYDTIGNITKKDQSHWIIHPSTTKLYPKETNYVLNYVYGSTKPHAVTDAGDKLYTYDPAGNMTGWTHKQNGTRRTITWNEENRVKQIDDNGKSTYFLYDDAGERVVKRGQHGESIYVNRFYAVRNGELGTKHVFAGETRVVSKLVKTPNTVTANTTNQTNQTNTTTGNSFPNQGTDQALSSGRGKKLGIIRRLPDGYQTGINPPVEKDEFFYHGDHLGSSNMITDAYGAVYQHLEYFPYGESWIEEGGSYGGNTPGYKFTGKELDPETGLYYYGARYYDPVLSRWISADPILGKYLPTKNRNRDQKLGGFGGVYNPANFGLYSYAHNNPVKFVDPDGEELKETQLPGLGKTYLDDAYIPKVEAWTKTAKEKGVELHFNSAFRTLKKQADLKSDPNAITPADKSLHSAGFATDVNFTSLKDIKEGLTGDEQRKIIRETAKEAGISISWGGEFKKKDPPHFYSDPGGDRNKLINAAQKKYQELTDPKGNESMPLSTPKLELLPCHEPTGSN